MRTPGFDGVTCKLKTQDPDPRPHPYRGAIRDPAAGVHCPKSSATQNGSHLVNLFKWLLFHFD